MQTFIVKTAILVLTFVSNNFLYDSSKFGKTQAVISENLEKEDNVSIPLLKIGRSVDKNEAHYFVNIDKDNKINENEPIKILWKNNQKNGQYEKINWIKKKFAYGIKHRKIGSDEIEFNFVALNSRKFYLKKNLKNEFAIFAKNEGSEVLLQRIFVFIEGGSFWKPNVTKVELAGMEMDNATEYLEILKL